MKTLIEELMKPCHIIDKVSSDDSVGGSRVGYQVGASIQAAVIKNSSTEAIVAEKQGATEILTVVVYKGSLLDYHTVIRRDADNEYFIIISHPADNKAPEMSTVPIEKHLAERWKKPEGVIIREGNSG